MDRLIIREKMLTSKKFGNYILLKKIGSGGMAELFLARQVGIKGFERILAIKRILPHLTKDSEFIEMFINEAKLAAQITHPNVVQIYDFGVVDDIYYIAMEYIMGKSLADILVKGKKLGFPMPGGLACLITSKIAAGLHYGYKGKTPDGKPLGIIHRDVSPQNILVSYHGEVKLVDFGIAKATSSSSHTNVGTLKGKISYLSPEQAWGKPVDHRSDLFSLAIVLHEMLTERRLFKSQNEFDTLEMVRSAQVPAPSAIKPFLPKDLDHIALKALAKNPQDRYLDAQVFEQALEAYLHSLTVAPTTRDLSDYLRLLYQNDIETDLNDFKQATRIDIHPSDSEIAKTVPITAPSKKENRISWKKIAISAAIILLFFVVLKGKTNRAGFHQNSVQPPPVDFSQPTPSISESRPSSQTVTHPASTNLPVPAGVVEKLQESSKTDAKSQPLKLRKTVIRKTEPKTKVSTSFLPLPAEEKSADRDQKEYKPAESVKPVKEDSVGLPSLPSAPTVNFPVSQPQQTKPAKEETPIPILP